MVMTNNPAFGPCLAPVFTYELYGLQLSSGPARLRQYQKNLKIIMSAGMNYMDLPHAPL